MKVLLIGGSGQLGTDLQRHNTQHDIVAPAHDALDIRRPQDIGDAFATVRPAIVINCAAFHNVPLCETERDAAFDVNATAVETLAKLCAQHHARFVTFSTDYVFDGTKRTPYAEDDSPAPLQVYGESRLAGERAALSVATGQTMVIRTCGLYGRAGSRAKSGNFVDNRIADARNGIALDMASDQTVAPTATDDLAPAVWKLIAHPAAQGGIYHLVNDGECTWYEFTRAIFDHLGTATPLRPVDRGGLSGVMRRPLYSVLANTRARALGITLPSWRDALRRYMSAV